MEEQKTSRNSGAPESESENMHEEVRAPRQAVPDGEAERGGPVSAEMEERESFRFCPHCGHELPVRGTDFCAFCGRSIRQSDPDQPARTVSLRNPSAEQSAVVRWILPICALSMIALIIGYLFGNFFSMSASLGEGLELDDAIKINGIELIRLAFEIMQEGKPEVSFSSFNSDYEKAIAVYNFCLLILLCYILMILLAVFGAVNVALSQEESKEKYLRRNRNLMILITILSLLIFALYLGSKNQIAELVTGMSGGLTDEFISYSSITGWLFGISLVLTLMSVYAYDRYCETNDV